MRYYLLTATLLAPLAIQRERQTSTPAALEYLPGSTLRGAVAAQHLRLGRAAVDKEFQAFIVQGEIKFPNLYPVGHPGENPAVLPMTAMSCKRFPGFKSQSGHGVKDTLAMSVLGRIEGKVAPEPMWICPEPGCGHELKPFGGVWTGDAGQPAARRVMMQARLHTGIDRNTGTVTPAVFYTTQSISEFCLDEDTGEFEPQSLGGGIYLDDDQHRFLANLLDSGPIYAGADRTRGMGEMRLELAPVTEPDFDLAGWDVSFRRSYASIGGRGLPDGLLFSIGLSSPTILVDRFLRPTGHLSLRMDDVEIVACHVRWTLVRGWQSAWMLPKPDDKAVAAGSVYLCRYAGGDFAGLDARLRQAAREGIGLRREEGFGRVRISDRFHVTEGL